MDDAFGEALRGKDMSGEEAPSVSVIVPTYGRPDRLAACLAALAAQDHAAFEVIVVDDGSEPPVDAVVREGLGKARYVRQANAGPAAARNKGASLADGPLLAFTDDDCRPGPGWLSALQAAHDAAPGALIGGRTRNGVAGNLYSDASQDLIGFLEDEDRTYFASNNIACPKERYDALGGFAESFPLAGGEDRDFGLRWGGRGWPLVQAPSAIVHHHHDLNGRTFWRQHANYGRGARHLRGLGDAGGGHRFARLGWYARLVTWPIRTRRPRAFRRAALLVVAQAATAWGFAKAGRER